jgi:hypothetical protein
MIRPLYVAAFLLLPLVGHAVEISGVNVPPLATVAGQPLVLNGAGVRRTLIFRIYLLALYLPSKTTDARDVLALPGPERISMVLLRDVTAPQLIDALETGIADNHTAAEIEPLRSRLDTLRAVMMAIGSARSGSVITLDYVPGAGTQVALDGSSAGLAIRGDDFYRALLKIWLGDDPADPALKKALLGSS